MQWPPSPRPRYQGAEFPSLDVDDAAFGWRRVERWTRGLLAAPVSYCRCCAVDRNHRVNREDSHVSIRRYARIRPTQEREKECHLDSPHHTAYARVNAVSSRPDTAWVQETRRKKVFFRARRGPPNRCVMLHFPTVFFDSADATATSVISRHVDVLGTSRLAAYLNMNFFLLLPLFSVQQYIEYQNMGNNLFKSICR